LYEQSANLFREFVGCDVCLAGLTRCDADRWNDSLITSGMATSSVRRHIRHLKVCMNTAIDRDILMTNPFDRIESASIAAKRGRIISDKESELVLSELPDTGYQLLFALARFGGLRSPSETMTLTWECIDLDQNRMEVYAPKTSQTRLVPILPQLRVLLEHAKNEVDDLSGPVLNISMNNHARTVANAAKRAGVESWNRTFQTLRQSFETIQCERFPEHVVAAWTGHSVEVSRAHYLTMRDEYFDEAAGRSIIRSTHARNEGEMHETARNEGVDRVARKVKQHDTLRNSPARIRTGDRAIMSRQL